MERVKSGNGILLGLYWQHAMLLHKSVTAVVQWLQWVQHSRSCLYLPAHDSSPLIPAHSRMDTCVGKDGCGRTLETVQKRPQHTATVESEAHMAWLEAKCVLVYKAYKQKANSKACISNMPAVHSNFVSLLTSESGRGSPIALATKATRCLGLAFDNVPSIFMY